MKKNLLCIFEKTEYVDIKWLKILRNSLLADVYGGIAW